MDIQDFGKHPLADRSLWVVRASAIALSGNGSLRHPAWRRRISHSVSGYHVCRCCR